MLKAIVTSGPTREKIDPIRYITNNSSGKQGHAIASALAKKEVAVTLVSGQTSIPSPDNVNLISVESADDMLKAVEDSLPADIFISTAAVCDWKPEITHNQKVKKNPDEDCLDIRFIKTPDILKTICNHTKRPKIVVGFAAETENLIENAKKKLKSKGCDFIVANNVSKGVFGEDNNKICLVSKSQITNWERMHKSDIADKLVNIILDNF